MLPSHFDLLLRAAAKKERDERRFQAQLAANLMNCWISKPVTGDQLLGLKEKPQPAAKGSAGEAKFAAQCPPADPRKLAAMNEASRRRREQQTT